MSRQLRILVAVAVIVMSFASSLHAATPVREFPYSKQTSLAPGTYTFVFSLFGSRAAATPLWTSGTVTLALKTPVLVYSLGSGTRKIPAAIDFSQQLYLKVVKTSPAPAAVIANRERLPIVPYALHSAAVTPRPIVMTASPAAFGTFAGTGPTATGVVGAAFVCSADGIVSIPFSAPVHVGGADYRLAMVEYCVTLRTGGAFVNGVVVASDQLTSGQPVTILANDLTDRTASGCYTLNVPASDARSYGMMFQFTGDATASSVFLTGIRTTWTPTNGAPAPVVPASDRGDLLSLIESGALAR